MTMLDIYAIGQALVDEEYRVPESFIQEQGLARGHRTLIDFERSQTLRQSAADQGKLVSRMNGGSGANSITAAAQLGASCHFSCHLGDDTEGDFYLNELKASGVQIDARDRVTDGHTGVCLVMVTPDAERTMNTYIGITDEIGPEDINEAALLAAKWVYLEGHLLISPSGSEAALVCRELARAAGQPVALNFCDPAVTRLCQPGLQQLLAEPVDLLFCNEEEALIWAQTTELDQACQALNNIAERWVMTRGDLGAIAFDGNKRFIIAAHSITAVNTTGAGDTFAGAFMYGLTQQLDFAQAGALASLASAEKVQQSGTRLNQKQLLEVRQLSLGW
ncbi:MAG: adenosine kinase [Saccharospirillum sp.]|nr:adenosine kinase [Saccharospirillum sp.]